jgi:GNAT superfamily N-acetyltransferase
VTLVDPSWSVARVVDPGSRAVAAVASLLHDVLGPGYGVADLPAMVADPERAALFVAHEGPSTDVVGAAAALVAGPAEQTRLDRDLVRVGATDIRPSGGRVGMFRAMAVAPHARGKGIGDALVRARLAFLRTAGCTEVYVASWVSGAREHSLGILRRNGFEALGELADYWHEPGGPPVACVRCGPVCRCSAVLMRLRWAPPAADSA